MKKQKIPRQYSLVKIKVPKKLEKYYGTDLNRTFCYLGEIPNMEGHAVVIEIGNNKIRVGMYIENFVELKESEHKIYY